MTIWSVEHQIDDNLAMVTLKNFNYKDPVIYFDGSRRQETWQIPEADFYQQSSTTKIVNFPFFKHGALLCDSDTWDALRSSVGTEIEALPVNVASHRFWLLNLVSIIDCLNKQVCKFTYFRTGKVKSIESYSFNLEKLKGVHLFKTPELSATSIYATDLFRDLVLAHGFSGVTFKPL